MMLRNTISVVFSLFLLFSCTNKAEKYFKEAELLEQSDRLPEAINFLDKAIEEDENYLPAYINRGAYKSMLGDYRGAIQDYCIIIEKDSSNILSYHNRGKNKKRLGEYNKAISDFGKALSLKGYDGSAGPVILIKIDNSLFETPSDKYLCYEPTISEILYERSIAYFYLDSLSQALNDLNYCISKGNLSQTDKETDFMLVSDCYYWRGFIFLKMGHKEKGCEDLHKAAELSVPEAESEIEKYCL